MQDKTRVAQGLDEIAALLEFAGEAEFKVRAYEHAASVVRTLGDELGELVEQDRLRELQGIGAATSRQIGELWSLGTSEYLARLRAEHPEGAAELVQVAGMTPRRIRALAASLGVRSVEGLRDACAAGRVRGVPGFGEKTERRKNSVLEMAAAAHALGMKYITITDHSPSAHYAGGLALDRLERQWDDIAAAEEQVPIRILRGTESDILMDGQLDFPDAVLEQFDVVIASIHARHRMDRSAMTARLVRAMSLPIFKIWGHALGRILNHREPIDCDVPAVLDALASSRGAIS